jgi:hypothetical protein
VSTIFVVFAFQTTVIFHLIEVEISPNVYLSICKEEEEEVEKKRENFCLSLDVLVSYIARIVETTRI